jgi:hypothetical protein
MIKKVYPLQTFALFAKEPYVLMATIAHNRTEKDVFEVLKQLYEDVKASEEEAFLF